MRRGRGDGKKGFKTKGSQQMPIDRYYDTLLTIQYLTR